MVEFTSLNYEEMSVNPQINYEEMSVYYVIYYEANNNTSYICGRLLICFSYEK